MAVDRRFLPPEPAPSPEPTYNPYGLRPKGYGERTGELLRQTYSNTGEYEPPLWARTLTVPSVDQVRTAEPAGTSRTSQQGFGQRFQLPNPFTQGQPQQQELGGAAGDFLAGPGGVALGVTPGAGPRGGFMDGIATAPITLANFPTYGREGMFALLSSIFLEGGYQQPEGQTGFGEDIEYHGPENLNPGQAFLKGTIEANKTIGDVVWGLFDGVTNFWRDSEAQYRGSQVQRIFREGHANRPVLPWEQGFIDNVTTSIFGGSAAAKYSLDELRAKANADGVNLVELVATYYDLPPEIVGAIADNPDMEWSQIEDLTRGAPISQDPLNNLLAEGGFQLLLMAAGGIGAVRGAGLVAGVGKGLGSGALEGFGAAAAGTPFAATTNAARITKAAGWATRKALQLNAVNTAGGWTVRGFEWGVKQYAGIAGDQALADTMDRLLWEMPWSMNPGLNLIDGFTTHPIRHAKQLLGRDGAGPRIVIGDEAGLSEAGTLYLTRQRPTRLARPDGSLDTDAITATRVASGDRDIEIAGVKETLPADHPTARLMEVVETLTLDDMSTLLKGTGWDRQWLEMAFGAGNRGGRTVDHLRDWFTYAYGQVVRDRGFTAQTLDGATVPEKSRAFFRQNSPEILDSFYSDLKGETRHVAEAVKGRWWELDALNDSRMAVMKSRIKENYDPRVAFEDAVHWIDASRAVQQAYRGRRAALAMVPTMARRINVDYLKSFREELLAKYERGAKVSNYHVQTLRRRVGPIEEYDRRLTTHQRKRWTREELVALLDRVEAVEAETGAKAVGREIPRDWVPEQSFEADARVLGLNNEDGLAIQLAMRMEQPPASIPTGLVTKFAKRVGRSPESLMADPRRAWGEIIDWYTSELDKLGEAAQTRRRVLGMSEALEARAADGLGDATRATAVADAADRIAVEVVNEPRVRPRGGVQREGPGTPLEYADEGGVARWNVAAEAAGKVAGKIEKHLGTAEEPNPMLNLKLVTRGEHQYAVRAGLEGELNNLLDIIDTALTDSTVLLDDVARATLADPSIHPYLKLDTLKDINWELSVSHDRAAVLATLDGDRLARELATEIGDTELAGAAVTRDVLGEVTQRAIAYADEGVSLGEEIIDVQRQFDSIYGQLSPEATLITERMRVGNIDPTTPVRPATVVTEAERVSVRQRQRLSRAETDLAAVQRQIDQAGQATGDLTFEPAIHANGRPVEFRGTGAHALADQQAALMHDATGNAYQVEAIHGKGRRINGYRIMEGKRAVEEAPPVSQAEAPDTQVALEPDAAPAVPARVQRATEIPTQRKQRSRWSAVETGKPKTVWAYHSDVAGRRSRLTSEAREARGRDTEWGEGWYGHRDEDIARDVYGAADLYEVNFENPYVVVSDRSNVSAGFTNEQLAEIRAAGHDGIIVKPANPSIGNHDRTPMQLVVFGDDAAKPLTGSDGAIEQAYATGDIETGQRLNLEAEARGQAANTSDDFARLREEMRAQADAEAAEPRARWDGAPEGTLGEVTNPPGESTRWGYVDENGVWNGFVSKAEAERAHAAASGAPEPAANAEQIIPEAIPEPVAPAAVGARTTFPDPIDEAGRPPVEAQFELVEEASLIDSSNPAFRNELQPRDRSRATSDAQIETMGRKFDPKLAMRVESGGDGPPLVTTQNEVLAGNGRTMAMRKMDEAHWDAYRQELVRNADKFGLTPEQILGMDRPVLVRRVDDAVATAEYADAFNARTGNKSAAEQAVALESRITDADVRALDMEEGTSMAQALVRQDNRATVTEIIGRLPEGERGQFFAADGSLSSQGVTLLRGAMLAKVLPDRALVTRLIENTGDIARYTRGLEEALPQVIRAEAQAEIAGAGVRIGEPLAAAIRRIFDVSDRGIPSRDWPAEFTTQGFDFVEGAEAANALALPLSKMTNQTEVVHFLRGYADAVEGSTQAAGGLLIPESRTWQGMVNRGIERVNARRAAADEKAGRSKGEGMFTREDIEFVPDDADVTRATVESADGSVSLTTERPVISDEPVAGTLGNPERVHIEHDLGAIRDVPDGTPISFRPETPVLARVLRGMDAMNEPAGSVVSELGQNVSGSNKHSGRMTRMAFEVRRYLNRLEDGETVRRELHEEIVAKLNGPEGNAADLYLASKMAVSERWDAAGNFVGAYDPRGLLPPWMDMASEMTQFSQAASRIDEVLDPTGLPTAGVDDAVVAGTRPRAVDPDFEQTAGIRLDGTEDLNRMQELADSGARVVAGNADEVAQRAAQTTGGLPRGARPAVAVLNDVDPGNQLRNLEARRQRLQAEVDTLRAAAPPEGPPPPPSGVDFPADLLDSWGRYTGDELAASTGAAPPKSLGQITEAIRSIDFGLNGSLTAGEAADLRHGLVQYLTAKLDELKAPDASQAVPLRNVARRLGTEGAAGTTPLEHGQMLDDLAMQLGRKVYHVAGEPLEGYTGIGYDFIPPPTKSLDGGPLRTRLMYEEGLTQQLREADRIVPGLGDELASRQQRTWQGRLDDAQDSIAATGLGEARWVRAARNAADTVVGARPQHTIESQAIARFADDILQVDDATMARILADPNLTEAWEKARSVVMGLHRFWHDKMNERKVALTGFRQERRVGLVRPENMEAWTLEYLNSHGDIGANIIEILQKRKNAGDASPTWSAWRKADNRIRAYFAARPGGVHDYIERLYESSAIRIGSEKASGLTTNYHIFRFLMDARWLAMEFIETPILIAMREGPGTLADTVRVAKGTKQADILFAGEGAAQEVMKRWSWWLAQGEPGAYMRFREAGVFTMVSRGQAKGMVRELKRMAKEDPQLRAMLRSSGDSELDYIRKLDRDWTIMSKRGVELPEDELRTILKDYLTDGTITPSELDEMAKQGRWMTHPALEQAIAHANNPLERTMMRRFQVITSQAWDEATGLVFGQVDRSNLQRLMNHPLLYWPMSYMIKATKWLAGLMFDRFAGYDTGAGVAVTMDMIWQQHRDALVNDPEFQQTLKDNESLLFFAQMLFPITPWDIGVSLSPLTRLTLDAVTKGPEDDPYRRNIFGIGPGYSYFQLFPRMFDELSQKEGIAGTIGERGSRFLPVSFTKRPTYSQSTREAPPGPFDELIPDPPANRLAP